MLFRSRFVEPSERKTRHLHAEGEYSGAYLLLFEQIMRYGRVSTGADHPVTVHDRYVMAPSPIPRFDNPKMDQNDALILLGAGREKKIYAVPPYTTVRSLDFEDHPFEVERVEGRQCRLCGAENVYFDELVDESSGETYYQCNDTSYCLSRMNRGRTVDTAEAEATPAASQAGPSGLDEKEYS